MAVQERLATLNDRVAKDSQGLRTNGSGGKRSVGGMTNSISGLQKNVAGTVVGGGHIVASVAGAVGASGISSALEGSSKTTYSWYKESNAVSGLRGFYRQFSTGKLNSIDRVDPFSTFECEFLFFPSVTGVQDVTKITKSVSVKEVDQIEDEDFHEEMGGGDVDSKPRKSKTKKEREEKGKFTPSTVIGKLFQDVLWKNMMFQNEQAGQDQVQSSTGRSSTTQNKTVNGDGTSTTTTTVTQDLIQQIKRPITKDLYVSLGVYIQKVTLPNIQVDGGSDVLTPFGKFVVPGNIVTPSDMTFSMDVVNVQAPVIENIFYPWMRETTLPWWSYDDQPFTTAIISFDFTNKSVGSHSNAIYRFYGCRPTQIMTIQPDQAPTPSLTRQVTFTFDFMAVETVGNKVTKRKPMPGSKSSGPKSSSSGGNLANGALFSATNTLKL